jgi:hypothetical protein
LRRIAPLGFRSLVHKYHRYAVIMIP